jgi:phosphate transport system substrate-binding protein
MFPGGTISGPLGVEGLAIIVHPRNPLTTLPLKALQDIFAGRLADWSEFGASAGPIVPLTVSAGTDTYFELQRMLMGMTGVTGDARLVPSFQAMRNYAADECGAIG